MCVSCNVCDVFRWLYMPINTCVCVWCVLDIYRAKHNCVTFLAWRNKQRNQPPNTQRRISFMNLYTCVPHIYALKCPVTQWHTICDLCGMHAYMRAACVRCCVWITHFTYSAFSIARLRRCWSKTRLGSRGGGKPPKLVECHHTSHDAGILVWTIRTCNTACIYIYVNARPPLCKTPNT